MFGKIGRDQAFFGSFIVLGLQNTVCENLKSNPSRSSAAYPPSRLAVTLFVPLLASWKRGHCDLEAEPENLGGRTERLGNQIECFGSQIEYLGSGTERFGGRSGRLGGWIGRLGGQARRLGDGSGRLGSQTGRLGD